MHLESAKLLQMIQKWPTEGVKFRYSTYADNLCSPTGFWMSHLVLVLNARKLSQRRGFSLNRLCVPESSRAPHFEWTRCCFFGFQSTGIRGRRLQLHLYIQEEANDGRVSLFQRQHGLRIEECTESNVEWAGSSILNPTPGPHQHFS